MSAHYAMCKYDDDTGTYVPLEVRPITDELIQDDPLYKLGAASRDAEIEEHLEEINVLKEVIKHGDDQRDRDLELFGQDREQLRSELAAAIAACKVKDEALDLLYDSFVDYVEGGAEDEVMQIAESARNLQPDTSALEAIVKKAGEVMREKAAQMLLNGNFLHDQAPGAILAREAAKAIRALTAVTLEDLK